MHEGVEGPALTGPKCLAIFAAYSRGMTVQRQGLDLRQGPSSARFCCVAFGGPRSFCSAFRPAPSFGLGSYGPTPSVLPSPKRETSRRSLPTSCRVRSSRPIWSCSRSSDRWRRRASSWPSAFQAAIDRDEFPETLANYLARLPQVFSIAIADREGQIVISTAGWTATRFNVAGRDFFWKAVIGGTAS